MTRLALVYDVAYPFVEGGGQKRMYEIARHFVAWGWDVHWYCLKTWEGSAIQMQAGITYHGLEGYTNFYTANGTRSRRAAISFGWAILRSKERFAGFDVVWCGQWPFFHIFALTARLIPWRTQLLVDWWEVWGRYWTAYGGYSGVVGRLLELFLANFITRAGHAVAISHQGIEQTVALGAPRHGLTYIPNGVNMKEFESIPPADGARDIVSFGRIKDHKNIDHIVHAIAIAKLRGRELTADIIGDGPELNKIRALAMEQGVSDLVTFHGQLDDARLVSLLKRARIFVHPSTKEAGGSITLLEANACGLPIVCYRHPLGIDPSLIVDRGTGLMVDSVGPEGLLAGIEEMLRVAEDANIRHTCIEHAREFDWSMIADRYRRMLDELLKKQKPS